MVSSHTVERLQMRIFWREAGAISRIALVCAFISTLVNLTTFLGWGSHGPLAASFIMHLVAMALFFLVFIKTGYHHVLYSKRGLSGDALPGFGAVRPLVVPSMLAFGYLLFNFISSLVSYGEGYPELTGDQYFWVRHGIAEHPMALSEVIKHQVLELRMFSSAWIFFLLMTAGWDDIVSKRIAALKCQQRGGPTN